MISKCSKGSTTRQVPNGIARLPSQWEVHPDFKRIWNRRKSQVTATYCIVKWAKGANMEIQFLKKTWVDQKDKCNDQYDLAGYEMEASQRVNNSIAKANKDLTKRTIVLWMQSTLETNSKKHRMNMLVMTRIWAKFLSLTRAQSKKMAKSNLKDHRSLWDSTTKMK